MSIREEKLQIKIPTLKGQQQYLSWKTAILTYLGSKSLRHFVKFHIQCPILLNSIEGRVANTPDEDEIRFQQIVNQFLTAEQQAERLAERFPQNIKEEILGNVNLGPKIIHLESPHLPRDLLHYVTEAILILIGPKLYTLYLNRTTFIKALTKFTRDEDKAKSVIRSSLGYDNIHLFDSGSSV